MTMGVVTSVLPVKAPPNYLASENFVRGPAAHIKWHYR